MRNKPESTCVTFITDEETNSSCWDACKGVNHIFYCYKCMWYAACVDPCVRMPDGNLFIALGKRYVEQSEAYLKACKVVGKMCKKDVESKYFANHKMEEHACNGDRLSVDEAAYASSICERFAKVLNS